MGKYGNSLGIMEVKIDDVVFECKPTFAHKRKFRKIIMDDKLQKDKNALFDRFSDHVLEMIREFDPEEFEENEVRDFIESNISELFKQFMIAYKYSTQAKWDEQEKMGVQELKKQLAGD